jgi:hypothetical protein
MTASTPPQTIARAVLLFEDCVVRLMVESDRYPDRKFIIETD